MLTPQASEAAIMLAKITAALKSGEPDYEDMTPELEATVKAQADTLIKAMQTLGFLNFADYQGEGPNGMQGFRCKFDHGQADLVIALNKKGKATLFVIKPPA